MTWPAGKPGLQLVSRMFKNMEHRWGSQMESKQVCKTRKEVQVQPSLPS